MERAQVGLSVLMANEDPSHKMPGIMNAQTLTATPGPDERGAQQDRNGRLAAGEAPG